MLGHVAQSVGGALPGAGAGNPLVGQILTSNPAQTFLAPEDGFAFIEVIGRGGAVGTSGTYASAGAAASDAIVQVAKNDEITTNLTRTVSGVATSSVSVRGAIIISAAGPTTSTVASQSAPAGKYSGNPSVNGVPGKGGGRLAGETVSGTTTLTPGYGSGRVGNGSANVQLGGGCPAACATFFSSYEAALAFANSLYGGNWQP